MSINDALFEFASLRAIIAIRNFIWLGVMFACIILLIGCFLNDFAEWAPQAHMIDLKLAFGPLETLSTQAGKDKPKQSSHSPTTNNNSGGPIAKRNTVSYMTRNSTAMHL